MLTTQQKEVIKNMDNLNPKTRRVIRKRILDRMFQAIGDMNCERK